MFPKHLKLNAVLSGLDSPTAIGRDSPHSRPIGVPVFLKKWPSVHDLLKGAGNSLSWIWSLVSRIVQRVARLFGVKASVPQSPPREFEPGAELHADAVAGEAPHVAQNLADAADTAATEVDAFLRELLDSAPAREQLKDGGAPAFLASALRALGSRLEVLRTQEQDAAQAFRTAVDETAHDLGVEPLHVLRLAQSDRASGAFAQLAPLWQHLQDVRGQVRNVSEAFCGYCIVAMRSPDGTDQAAVDEVARAAAARWADASMMERIRIGVAAPALPNGLAAAESTEDAAADDVEKAASAAFQGQPSLAAAEDAPRAAGGGARPASGGTFEDMMRRFQSRGLMDDPPGDASHRPTA